ncbi:MAG: hypothetical protein V7640_2006 [Betaproteobacteria bacterium]
MYVTHHAQRVATNLKGPGYDGSVPGARTEEQKTITCH